MGVMCVFKILGLQTREDVVDAMASPCEDDKRLLLGIIDNDIMGASSAEEILEWIGREGTKETTRERRARYMDHIITNELLPHMGLTDEPHVNRRKALFLAYMVLRLIRVYRGVEVCDDRDNYANKRIDTAGTLMALLFRQVYRNQLKTITAQLTRTAMGPPFF